MAQIGMSRQDYIDRVELAYHRAGWAASIQAGIDAWDEQARHYETVIMLLQNALAKTAPPDIPQTDNEQALIGAGALAIDPAINSVVAARVYVQTPHNNQQFELYIPNQVYPAPFDRAVKEVVSNTIPIFRREPLLEDVTSKIFEPAIDRQELLNIARYLATYKYFRPESEYQQQRLEAFNQVWPSFRSHIKKYRNPGGGNRDRALRDFKRVLDDIYANADRRSGIEKPPKSKIEGV